MSNLTVRLSALTTDMTDGELLKWIVAEGDEVAEGDPIAEFTTDKVDTELESPYSGRVVALLVEEAAVVEVGDAIATIESEQDDLLGGLDFGDDDAVGAAGAGLATTEWAGDESGAGGSADGGSADGGSADGGVSGGGSSDDGSVGGGAVAGAARDKSGDGGTSGGATSGGGAVAGSSAPDTSGGSSGLKASRQSPSDVALRPAPPPVRKRAKREGINLHDVTPTGSRGQVTHADLDAYLASSGAVTADSRRSDQQGVQSVAGLAVVDSSAMGGPGTVETGAPRPGGTRPGTARPEGDRAQSRPARAGGDEARRQRVRAATAASTTRSAAIPQFTLFRRADVTETATRRGGIGWTTILARSYAAMLWRHPELNARWDEERGTVVHLAGVRIGLAVDTPTGLVVVALDDPDKHGRSSADATLRAAAERARDGNITREDLENVSATISNLGGWNVERFTALLVPPQASILSVGAIAEQPAVVDGRVKPRLKMELGMTVDHRVADGADAARALQTLVEILEDA